MKIVNGLVGVGSDVAGFVGGSMVIGKTQEMAAGRVPYGDLLPSAALVFLSIMQGGKGGRFKRRLLRGAGIAGGVRLLRTGLTSLDNSDALGSAEKYTVAPMLGAMNYI